MLEKLLRFPLPDQLKAVAEKIDLLDDASSDGRISSWVRGSSSLSKYERWVLKRALRKRERARTLCEAMTLVITPEPTHGEYLTGRISYMTSTIDGDPIENYNTLSRKFMPQTYGTITS